MPEEKQRKKRIRVEKLNEWIETLKSIERVNRDSEYFKQNAICDGFACSAASVIFMAGDERIINEASLLMIHNAWTYANGNATIRPLLTNT
jgi:ATP-dependent protease ClpP protease subunit|nr:MAG TPA: Putative ATP dependent Clp protease [Caudoviricetes sp.]